MYKVDVYPRVRRVMMVEGIGVRGSREVIGLNWDPVGKANTGIHISSLDVSAERLLEAVRAHWSNGAWTLASFKLAWREPTLGEFLLTGPVLRQTSATSVSSSAWRRPQATCSGPYLNSS